MTGPLISSFNVKASDLTEHEPAPLAHHCVARYVKCLKHCHRVVLSSWVFVSIALYVFGTSKLMGLTRNEFEPPHGSASQVSYELITKYFPGIDSRGTDVFYLEVEKGHSVVDSGLLKDFTDSVNKELLELLPEDLYAGLSVAGYYSSVDNGLPPAVVRAQFVSLDDSSSFLVIQYPNDITLQYGRIFYNCLLSLQSRHNGSDHVSFIGGGGNAVQSVEAVDEANKSLAYMDLVSMPLAFAIFAVSLSSIRLILLPFVTLVVSYITAFGILGLLARAGVSVSSATPLLMMSMLIAVSIDYSLFLLTRFTEEVKKGMTFDAAVAQMLEHSGHTVCASGFTLAFCFLALLFFPLHMMQSIGIGVIVSILSAIVVNLTLIPAALFAHPAFFAKSSDFKCLSRCCRRSTHSDHTVSPLTDELDRIPTSKAFEATQWYRWAIFATSRRAAVVTIFILLLLGGLAMVRCKSMHHSMDTWLFAPRVSLTLETFQRFSQHFPVGSTGPFQLLLLPNPNLSTCASPLGGTGIYSEAFWTNATGLLSGIVAEVYGSKSEQLADAGSAKAQGELHSVMHIYNVPGSGFQPSTPNPGQQSSFSMPMKFALFFDPEAPEDTSLSELCNSWKLYLAGLRAKCHHFLATKNCKDLVPLAPALARSMRISRELVPGACTAFQALLNSSTTSTRDAVYATLIPAVLERSRESVEWTRRCREFLMANAEKYPCVKAHLNGVTPQMVDAIDSIYERAPTILSMTMGVCFVLVSSLTSSLAFGVSSVSLIAWTLLLVFSIGDIVYRGNALEAFGLAMIAGSGGLAWLVPPLTFSMIFGLGLDYNIFLLGRVCEFHCAGFSDRDALAYGLAKTGPVISNAGLIMAVAFSGLMLSGIPMMNQVGFLLVVAVFIDTFFVRPLATPALHAPLKAWNWWPRGACNQ